MISNFELEDLADKRNLDLIGVFSKDRMPNEKQVGSYIINMQNEDDGSGTHWVAIKLFKTRKCCYFDSFGVGMPMEIDEWTKNFKPVATNNRQIQDIKSQMCGFFCLSFIEFFQNFDDETNDVFEAYDDYLNLFSSDPKTNDKIVCQLLEKWN